jgi:hypothetical protein
MPAGEPFTIALEPRADTVKNAPFSGVGTTEVVNTLADGNRIVRTNTMRYYRDSGGRTRTEYSLAAIGPFTPDQAQTIVTIADPVTGQRYVLHSALKRADVFNLSGSGVAGGPEAGAIFYKRTFVAGAIASGAVPANASGPATAAVQGYAAVPPNAAGSPTGAPAGEIGVAPPIVVMSGPVGMPPSNAAFLIRNAPMGAGPEGCKPVTKALPAPVSLGERNIEGLKVSGSRREFTIAAGAIGNEQPIVVRSEQWFSPDLGVVVSSTHHDPMIGDTNYKLEQISRAEPDPALFTVPADYAKEEITGFPGARFETFGTAGPPGSKTRVLATPAKPASTEK